MESAGCRDFRDGERIAKALEIVVVANERGNKPDIIGSYKRDARERPC